MANREDHGLTALGKLVIFLVIAALAGTGFWLLRRDGARMARPAVNGGTTTPSGANAASTPATASAGDPPVLAETRSEVPLLAPAEPYQVADATVELELSEYAGYAGLIVANGGLAPSADSSFFRNHGFKLKITLSEEESWSALNAGRIAASATTVDVLAVYGRRFHVVVPAQIGFSRGADGILVRREVAKLNALKGKVIVTAQFTEADFFIRYLAQEAGLGVAMLPGLTAEPDPTRLNLVYAADAFGAGDVFLADLASAPGRLAGAVTWAPKTTEVVESSGGRARILATNRNVLIVADVLVVNRGFAERQPAMVAALVRGLLEGNRMVRDNPEAHLDTIARAFGWERAQARAELAKVHLSNLPENLAFFSGAMDAAGSFGGIYQSAVLAYGSELIRDPVDGARFLELSHLRELEKSGSFGEQTIAIAPIRSGAGGQPEGDPLLSKDIRFLFAANSAQLEMPNPDNLANLEAIRRLLEVSPGSTVLLRGHVDGALVEKFRKEGGDAFVRQMALKAMDLSRNRAAEIQRLLVEKHRVDRARLEIVGRGWEEPASQVQDENRRVEAQWFTVE